MGVFEFIQSSAWAMKPSVLQAASDIAYWHARGKKASATEIASVVQNRDTNRARSASRPLDGSLESPADQQRGYRVMDRIACVPIEGVICPLASLVNDVSQPRGTTTAAIIGSMQRANGDSGVDAILLDIDSPGGMVSGIEETGVAIAGSRKPVVTFFRYLGCSAAYWLGAAAQKIVAAETAIVGSIGVYSVLEDTSQRAVLEGRKVHVVKAGENKAIGVEGTEITPEQLNIMQDEILVPFKVFVRHVAKSRGMSEAQALLLADGKVYGGQGAVDVGLVDEVGLFPAALTLAKRLAGQPARTIASGGQSTSESQRRHSSSREGGSQNESDVQSDYLSVLEVETEKRERSGVPTAKARADARMHISQTQPELSRAYHQLCAARMEKERRRRRDLPYGGAFENKR